MKQRYKNKRDFYKAEAEANLRRAEEAERKLQEVEKKKPDQAAKKPEYYNVLVYCRNCQVVSSYGVRKGLTASQAGCIVCEAKGEGIILPVRKYPGQFLVYERP